jgi:excisionase family DNA binding protein
MTTDLRAVPRPATVSVELAARLLGVSRSTAYALARQGALTDAVPVLRLGGRRYRVPIRPLAEALGLSEAELVQRLRAAEAADDSA